MHHRITFLCISGRLHILAQLKDENLQHDGYKISICIHINYSILCMTAVPPGHPGPVCFPPEKKADHDVRRIIQARKAAYVRTYIYTYIHKYVCIEAAHWSNLGKLKKSVPSTEYP